MQRYANHVTAARELAVTILFIPGKDFAVLQPDAAGVEAHDETSPGHRQA